MKEEIKNLVNHANSILPNYQGVQTRYPEELKQIIATLVNHHKMNVKKFRPSFLYRAIQLLSGQNKEIHLPLLNSRKLKLLLFQKKREPIIKKLKNLANKGLTRHEK